MKRFVIKVFCVIYLAMAVNTRSINDSKIFDNKYEIGREGAEANEDIRENKAITRIDKIIANVTAKLNNLKEEYNIEAFRTKLPKLEKVIYDYPRETTSNTKATTLARIEDPDFIGTAQIEALLDNIKARALEMVAEQNPSVSDMITNTVTEATFEADPILTHLDITSPRYAFSTFVSLNSIDNVDKRTANEPNDIVSGDKHKVSVRSCKENAFTIAQSVEDMLQKELKSIYEKVKQKVSKDFSKEVKTAKSTIKSHATKVINKFTQTCGTESSVKSNGSRPNRDNKFTKTTSKTKEDETSATTVDDFAMLTLYEQILAKTHEDNVMKMLTTNKKRKIDEIVRLSKRNPETLTDLTLKKDVKMYDDGDNIPDVDYNNDITSTENNDSPTDPSVPNESTQVTVDDAMDDTSYEGLSDKIAYKDYVNGFKNYLNFQRDEAKQNFSALVKYQAHKHHKVDDIGKFILNKIPQLPNRKRRFFDDNDIDDLDLSTKGDDSWFKKHFYMFIDKGTPKKYHTSETVEFKDVTEANRVNPNVIEKPESLTDRNEDSISGVASLDELSRVLEDRKKFTSNVPYINEKNVNCKEETKQIIDESGFGLKSAPNIIKFYAPSISKFFGKRQKDLDNQETGKDSKNPKLNDDGDNFLFYSDLTRLQRHVKEKNDKEKSNETRILHKNEKPNKAKSKTEKVGCVSIVTQPTAIVNLHRINSKGSKVRRLLSKLHFHRKNKNQKKKEKRYCTRVQRFNPLKKLKDMFIPKESEKEIGSEHTDEDIMVAHIDTFKPVKYDNIPSIDELRNQVPNITVEHIETNSELVRVENEWTVHDETSELKTVSTEANTPGDFTIPIKQPKLEYTTWKQEQMMTPENVFTIDDIMNVNVKNESELKSIFSVSPITVDKIRSELDKLPVKMTSQSNSKDILTSPKMKIIESQSRIENFNKDNTNSDKTKANAKVSNPISNYKVEFKHNKTKNPTAENTEYDFSDIERYLDLHEDYPAAVEEKVTPQYETHDNQKLKDKMSALVENTLKIIDEEAVKEPVNNYKYPDYFHDLVRWNSDILHNDNANNPSWQDILKNMQDVEEYTTTNVGLIRKELSEMNEHLSRYNIARMENKALQKDYNRNSAVKAYITPNPKYFAKAKNKVDVEKNKLNNENLREFDDAYSVKIGPKSYSNLKSQDIINVINDLYTKKGSDGVFNDHDRSENERAKNSRQSLKSKHKLIRPVTTLNEMPKQFYNAPLPMKNENFERFLKENQLDVDSLTLPTIDMPVVTESWHSKMNSLTKVMDTNKKDSKDITNKEPIATKGIQATTIIFNDVNNIIDKSYPKNQMEYLDELEQEIIDDNVNMNLRLKRYNADYNSDAHKDALLVDKEKVADIKNERNNLFDKKIQEDASGKDSVADNNAFEITIINFDDDSNERDQTKTTKATSHALVKINATKNDADTINTEEDNEIDKEIKTNEIRNALSKIDVSVSDGRDKSKDLQDPINADISNDNLDKSIDIDSDVDKSNEKKRNDKDLPKVIEVSSYEYDVIYKAPKTKDSDVVGQDEQIDVFRIENKADQKSRHVRSAVIESNIIATNQQRKRYERDSHMKSNYDDSFDYKLFTVDGTKDIKNNAATCFTINNTVDNSTGKEVPFGKGDYVEGSANYDIAYYEPGLIKEPTNTDDNANNTKKANGNDFTKNKLKRDVNNIHTAKDVAAFEVIVDLMRNTRNNADKRVNVVTPSDLSVTGKDLKEKVKLTTNSIQVHIAIPYDVSNKKRSSDNVKVRKVFTAKLATPVDLEYQINSVGDDVVTTSDYGLLPGTYLLIDDDNKARYAFNPVKMTEKTKDITEEKADKINISKEFVAAVNKYLVQLYRNITSNEKENVGRKARDTRWSRVKKYFGRDRICPCKCKANKPMCRTCAACDAVIKELIFEFDNLAKYMNDHCTEIQTFFWMNPSSGRALRDIVHKIDKSLNDYYKRVKGKCSGRKCKTFATYIDKRGSKNKKIGEIHPSDLLNDLKSLNEHFDNIARLIPYDVNLKEKGDELINTLDNCIGAKSLVKRTQKAKRESNDKDVYTLENISVNIICSPSTESNTPSAQENILSMISENGNVLDYDSNKRNYKKFKNSQGKVKPFLQKLFTYYDTQTQANTFKREVKLDQIESPLIADTGGTFWRDYLNKGLVEKSNDDKTEEVEMSVVETNSEENPTISTKDTASLLSKIDKSQTELLSKFTDAINEIDTETTDSLSNNINELFKLMTTVTEDKTEGPITFTEPTIIHKNCTAKHKKKKVKSKKHKKVHKISKAKFHPKHNKKLTKLTYPLPKSSNHDKNYEIKTSETSQTEDIKSTKAVKGLDKEREIKSTIKSNLFDKIKKVTLGFLSNAKKDNKLSNVTLKDSENHTNNEAKDRKQTDVFSDTTTQMNPLVIVKESKPKKDKSKFRNILLSLLNYESDKINKERNLLNGKNAEVKVLTDGLNRIQSINPDMKVSSPGLIERVALKFRHKVAATTTADLKLKYPLTQARLKRFSYYEEAEAMKNVKKNSNDLKQDGSKVSLKSSTIENTCPWKSHPEFDVYEKNVHGLYRWRKEKDYSKRDFRKIVTVFKNGGHVRSRKGKRSNDETNSRFVRSTWLKHSPGFFVATITSFYIVLATFAAVINWIFGR